MQQNVLEYEEKMTFSWEILKSLKYTLYNYNQANCHHNYSGGNFQLVKILAVLNSVDHSIGHQHQGLTASETASGKVWIVKKGTTSLPAFWNKTAKAGRFVKKGKIVIFSQDDLVAEDAKNAQRGEISHCFLFVLRSGVLLEDNTML